ncbi:hypothetical protein [Haloarchaeobius amylolyticus]|uniref:hypothetical protein n=1 Tax=Haloarchaeobius amylolyticus TaxID=1198296 RepID=UPI00226F8D55|nr:hypothetical protein [Haloarchaeobius amylolyticus]
MQRDETAYRHDRASLTTTRDLAAAVSRYDLVLAVIPLSFVAAAGWSAVTDASTTTTVGMAGVVCLLALLDALFVNPPRQGRRGAGG